MRTQRPIRLYPLSSIRYTPFDPAEDGRAFIRQFGYDLTDDLGFLAERGVVLADSPWQSDVFLLTKYPGLSRRAQWLMRLMRWKPVLIWTDEPRYVPQFEARIPPRGGLPEMHIMNVYTGDVFLSNTTMFGWAVNQCLPLLDVASLPEFRERPVVALATYITDMEAQRFVRYGEDLDLVRPRQELILTGHEMGLVDVYGRHWPNDMACSESRGGDWYTAKIEILKQYQFNICFENTNFDYYCTEKIWDSIRGGCLPIYVGRGNRIYEDFPPDSFLDYAEFDSAEELCAHIRDMTRQEYVDRMNRCITAYNRLYERHDFVEQRERSLLKIVEKVYEIAG